MKQKLHCTEICHLALDCAKKVELSTQKARSRNWRLGMGQMFHATPPSYFSKGPLVSTNSVSHMSRITTRNM